MNNFFKTSKKSIMPEGSEGIFLKNDDDANRLGMIYFICAVILLLVLDIVELVNTEAQFIWYANIRFYIAAIALAMFFIEIFVYYFIGRYKSWFKFFIITNIIIFNTLIAMIYGANMDILIILPVFLSCRYTSYSFNIYTMIVTLIGVFGYPYISLLTFKYCHFGYVDLNDLALKSVRVVIEAGADIYDTLTANRDFIDVQNSFLTILIYRNPLCVFEFIVMSIVSLLITKSTKSLLFDQTALTKKEEANKSELKFAQDIQLGMLPTNFDEYNSKKKFEIYASMDAAKDVGGDLYDFFMPDDDHLAIVIADVSGKGMPAALFMAKAKTLIRESVKRSLNTADIFTNVNDGLCEGNDMMLFVTGWIGMIDLKTLEMSYINAGHNPVVVVDNGKARYLVDRSGPALAAMEGVQYKELKIQLNHGDKVFLYTDGVTESIDTKKEMYSEDRLIKFIESKKEESCKQIIADVKADVNKFATGMSQFDDITMLCVEL